MSDPLSDLAELASAAGVTLACAESLTGGMVSSRLSRAPGASSWFAGGVVAYTEQTKFDVLGVEPGPVVSAACARQMAVGVARLLSADLAVAVTGVGGPDREEDQPVGTVHLAVADGDTVREEEFHLDGSPGDIVDATVDLALDRLLNRLRGRARRR